MSDSMRILDHPVLGPAEKGNTVTIYFEGKPISAVEGEPIAVALAAAGIKALHTTEKTHEPRGAYCMMGRCCDCMVVVDGVPNVRSCVTPVAEGMRVEMQHGLE